MAKSKLVTPRTPAASRRLLKPRLHEFHLVLRDQPRGTETYLQPAELRQHLEQRLDLPAGVRLVKLDWKGDL